MNSSTATKFAPVFSDERRIDVSMDSGETEISLSTWTEGLGWCTQKTMKLDAELLDELHRMISAARIKNRSRNMDEPEIADNAGKLLAFPAFL